VSRPRLLILALVGLSLAWVAVPYPCAAHTLPVRSQPAAGAVLDEAPRAVWIRFDGHLEKALCQLRVNGDDGKRVDLGPEKTRGGEPTVLRVALPPVAAGSYRVRWRAVGTDGHSTVGDYTFRVR